MSNWAEQLARLRTDTAEWLAVKRNAWAVRPGALAAWIRRSSTVTFSEFKSWGQFGNQLFHISAVLGYAAKYGCQPRLPSWRCVVSGRTYADHFPRVRKYFGQCTGVVYKEPSFAHRTIPFIYNVDLRGHFQSEKYFSHIRDEIRLLFSEPAAIGADLDIYCRQHALQDFDALHIRAFSDPIKDLGAVTGLLPDSYFLSALQHLKSERPLVLATDDKAAASQFLSRHSIGRPVHLLTFEDPLMDFYMLARAKRIAVSNSTFSWWAAYLRNATEIYAPNRKLWFRTSIAREPFRDSSDIIPDKFRELAA